jgi:hypothetical protein
MLRLKSCFEKGPLLPCWAKKICNTNTDNSVCQLFLCSLLTLRCALCFMMLSITVNMSSGHNCFYKHLAGSYMIMSFVSLGILFEKRISTLSLFLNERTKFYFASF